MLIGIHFDIIAVQSSNCLRCWPIYDVLVETEVTVYVLLGTRRVVYDRRTYEESIAKKVESWSAVRFGTWFDLA